MERDITRIMSWPGVAMTATDAARNKSQLASIMIEPHCGASTPFFSVQMMLA
jgi:hypothetical protein